MNDGGDKSGGPAFPGPANSGIPGMSLRAYIATAALQGMIAQSNTQMMESTLKTGIDQGFKTVEEAYAKFACGYADALINQLQKEEK